MASAGRGASSETATRAALLDAAAAVLVEEGYAAVTSRRLAQRVGVNNALVTYYFGTMDGLLIEMFQRGTVGSLNQLDVALRSPQPLWATWRLTQDFSSSAFTAEFFALAKHRPAVREVMSAYLQTFRSRQFAALTDVLSGHALDAKRWPPAALIFAMSSVSLYLNLEAEFDVHLGHTETVAMIEREIEALEGPARRATTA